MQPGRLAKSVWCFSWPASSILGPRRAVGVDRLGGGLGYCLDVSGDSGNLVGAVHDLEARHARAAVGDKGANEFFLALQRVLREHGAEDRSRQMRLDVADPAGLLVKQPARRLGFGQQGTAAMLRG